MLNVRLQAQLHLVLQICYHLRDARLGIVVYFLLDTQTLNYFRIQLAFQRRVIPLLNWIAIVFFKRGLA